MTFSRNFGRIARDETNVQHASSPHSVDRSVQRSVKVCFLYVKVVSELSEGGTDDASTLADSAKQTNAYCIHRDILFRGSMPQGGYSSMHGSNQ